MDRAAKEQELRRLQSQVEQLKQELDQEIADESSEGPEWAPKGYYFTYDVLAGCVLGLFGAATSLLFNIVGSQLVVPPAGLQPHPLNLIRVYLTFPLRETALQSDSGLAIAIGCCLYLGTGMVLGIPFQVAQTKLAPKATLAGRFLLSTILGFALWLINFYGILSWLQPLLLGGRWIVELIPWWVAMATHLVFGWTMALVYPLGVFVPYQQVKEQQ